MWLLLKELILTVSTLQRCGSLESRGFISFYFGKYGSLERTYFKFLLWEGVAVLKRTDFNSFSFAEGVAVLKELDFNSFSFGKGVAVLK